MLPFVKVDIYSKNLRFLSFYIDRNNIIKCKIKKETYAMYKTISYITMYNVPIVIDSLRESIESDMDMKRV